MIHSLYRDEVQDFTQAELLLDMRCVIDPNRWEEAAVFAPRRAQGMGK